ncbi:MAG: hypothetical protein JOY90_25510 [Bradyrhizobium sp.]|uniref:hypothetical protein n=1 Tax=Bradyrhizobium sp. TaxID=376 RepID=UPI001DDD33BF|nr:hypothetical protein [Bradyrhizobium sp.]
MANEAFALSPIAARSVQPGEADYEAIRDAFMETARGRWFLGEYAQRNRNADTLMVISAIARIEATLTSQQPSNTDADRRLAQALDTIGDAVEQAAATVRDSLQLEQRLAPIRKGARVIREISWRWREIGADGRICDLIECQVNVIETICDQIAGVDAGAALNAAFNLIKTSIDGLRAGDRKAPFPTADVPAPQPPSDSAAAAERTDDEAAMERVAAEMAAIDPDEVKRHQSLLDDGGFYITRPRPRPTLVVGLANEPDIMSSLHRLPRVEPTPASRPAAMPSMSTTEDALETIRHMSLMEKIDFFS